jgi:hypothetical protein
MKPLEAPRLTGTWCSVMLPVDEHDEIDFSRLERYVQALIDSGVDGIYTNGTAGEFYAQSEEEFDRISVIVAGRCESAGMPFQLGASHPLPPNGTGPGAAFGSPEAWRRPGHHARMGTPERSRSRRLPVPDRR